MFEELDPLGIPDLEPFEDMKSVRGLPRVFTELLWAAGAGEPALDLTQYIRLRMRQHGLIACFETLSELDSKDTPVMAYTIVSAAVQHDQTRYDIPRHLSASSKYVCITTTRAQCLKLSVFS